MNQAHEARCDHSIPTPYQACVDFANGALIQYIAINLLQLRKSGLAMCQSFGVESIVDEELS